MTTRAAGFVFSVILAAASAPAWAQSGPMKMPSGGTKAPMGGMNMPMAMPDRPARSAPTRQAYTTNHEFLVKLLSVPKPIPFEKYFDLRLAVYNPTHPAKPLPGARLEVVAGMRHGLTHGFAHGMQSSPKVVARNGIFTVSGMYFHMMGPWVLKTTVEKGGEQGTAYFRLPCCDQ